jgi:hypothetical protein
MRPRLRDAVEIMQRRFGLKPDATLRPGGPTERLVNAIVAGGLSALKPDAKRFPDRKAFQDSLKLQGSVGEGGDNAPTDRTWVRLGLGALGYLPLGAASTTAWTTRRWPTASAR